MSRKEKLIERFPRQPEDFEYQGLSKLLSGFGYIEENKVRTSGSGSFYNNENEHSIMLHKPHQGNTIKSYTLEYVLQELETLGFIEKNDK